MFAQPISMPGLTALFFYQNSPKIKLFLQKNAKFSSAGAPPPGPPPPPPPPFRISGYAPEVICPILAISETANTFFRQQKLREV